MLAELVRTDTSDGLRLDGALYRATTSDAAPLDAMLMLHGVGGNFYGSTLMQTLADSLLPLGIAALRVNTRGHDLISIAGTSGGPKWQGAAYETVSECRYDIRAWVTWLRAAGFERVGLMGHSLGAIKSLYAAAHDDSLNVQRIIAMSPPRLSYQAFQHDERSSLFLESMQTAQQHIAAGRPDALIKVRFPFPLLITAAGYVEKYGPAENYNILNFADRLPCPTLLVYGELEIQQGGVAFDGLPEALLALEHGRHRPTIAVIPQADHFYNGRYEPLLAEVRNWLV